MIRSLILGVMLLSLVIVPAGAWGQSWGLGAPRDPLGRGGSTPAQRPVYGSGYQSGGGLPRFTPAPDPTPAYRPPAYNLAPSPAPIRRDSAPAFEIPAWRLPTRTLDAIREQREEAGGYTPEQLPRPLFQGRDETMPRGEGGSIVDRFQRQIDGGASRWGR